MGRKASPSMPTRHQIVEAHSVARELCPGARIKGIGPEGVVFDYPDGGQANQEWTDKPFTGGPE